MDAFVNIIFRLAPPSSLVELSIGGLTQSHRRWIEVERVSRVFEEAVGTREVYFAPAVRREPRMGKAAVLGAGVAWIDVDKPAVLPEALVPPTVVVSSGAGLHIYWALTKFLDTQRLELVNRLAVQAIPGADVAAWNADRLLRVPGSYNERRGKPVEVVRIDENVYDPRDLAAVLLAMRDETFRRAAAGSTKGFRSRSERDWYVVRSLVRLGASDDAIRLLFSRWPCGDKAAEDPRYLEHTLTRAREAKSLPVLDVRDLDLEPVPTYESSIPDLAGVETETRLVPVVVEREREREREREPKHKRGRRLTLEAGSDGMYEGEKRISTFIPMPVALVQAPPDYRDEVGDMILCDVIQPVTGDVARNVPIPLSALTTTLSLLKHLPPQWTWFGSDTTVRLLRAWLYDRLIERGAPTVCGVPYAGFTIWQGRRYYVFPGCTLDDQGTIHRLEEELASDVPVCVARFPPPFQPRFLEGDPSTVRFIMDRIWDINRPDVVYPILGWVAAATVRPYLISVGYRMPTLMLYGMRGSGKTTTIARIIQPMLGLEPRVYDANTTKFVMLSLVSSSSSVPVSFGEYREALVRPDVVRMILLTYDTGMDARGRSDQTVVTYPLRAPLTIDGEDKIDDPAVLERSVGVNLRPEDVAIGTTAWDSCEALLSTSLTDWAYPWYLWTLQAPLAELLDAAEADCEDVLEGLSPRVRQNYTVVWFGIRLLHAFALHHRTRVPELDPAVLRPSIDCVYSVRLGRTPTAGDDFVEFVVNAAARGTSAFPWVMEGGVLWYHYASAYDAYATSRARMRRSVLGRSAIREQVAAQPFSLGPELRNVRGRTILAYGVHLEQAHAAGLDVPKTFVSKQLTITL